MAGAASGALPVVVCLLVMSTFVAPVEGTAAGSAIQSPISREVPADRNTVFQQNSPITPQNNTTVHHENPEAVNGESDLSTVQRWLSGHLNQVLIDCTQKLGNGQYNACNALDKKYPEWLNKYVEVSRELEPNNQGSDSKNTSKAFARAGENTQEYVSRVQRFNNTLASYREARENGNTDRARRLARRLGRLGQRINSTGRNLTESYQTISERTRANLTESAETVNTTTQQVLKTVHKIQQEQFTDTTLVARGHTRNISFLRPLRVTGYLVSENGTTLSGRTIRLQAGGESRTTTTNATGEFTFTYRPSSVTVDTQQVTIRYVPGTLSVYNASKTTVPVNIEQVEPTLNVTVQPNRAGFTDIVRITGRISAGSVGVPSMPVVVSIGGLRLSLDRTVQTGDDGRFRLVVRVPATIPAGQQRVRVTMPLTERAIARATATESIRIGETPTALSLNAPREVTLNRSRANRTGLNVTGRLVTDSGHPISGQQVEFRLNGQTLGVTQTGPNGTYATTIEIPPGLFEEQSGTTTATLVAVYSGTQTNLESSRATAKVRIILPTNNDLFEELMNTIASLPLIYQLVLGIGIILFGTLLMYVFSQRYRDQNINEQDHAGEKLGERSTDRSTNVGAADSSLFDVARKQLTAGDTEHAIMTAYTAIRTRLSEELDFAAAQAQTHWEFFDTCRRQSFEDGQLDVLRRLTEAYEQAAFAPQPTAEETAAEMIEHANTFDDSILHSNQSGKKDE